MPIFNVCGTNYQYPNVGEKPWGTIHIAWASAVSSCLTTVNTQVSTIQSNLFTNPMTTDGDIIYQDTSLPARLGIGAVGQVLTVSASNLPEWSTVAGTGNVVGPAGAVDENIAVYDGATGLLIKDGGITVAALQALIAASTITAWGDTAWTPTGSWVANTTYTGKFRRVGDSLEGVLKVATSGAPTAANLTVNLPALHTIDTTKLASTDTDSVLGEGYTSGLNSNASIFVCYNNTTSVAIRSVASGAQQELEPVDQTTPGNFGAGDYLTVRFLVPIVEYA